MFTMSEESLAALMAAMAPSEVPETGGAALPIYALVAALGGLLGASGLGLGRLQRRGRQAG